MSSTHIKGHHRVSRKRHVRFDGNRPASADQGNVAVVAAAQEVHAHQPPPTQDEPSRQMVIEEPLPTTFSFTGPRPDDAKYLDWENRLVYTHQLHPLYISAAVRAFQEFDTNRKDQLNSFQFTNAMADFTIKFPQFGHPTDRKMSEMFNYLDEGKGYVNFDEWITGITLMTNREKFVIQQMEQTFDALDTGKQGYISIDQLAKFLRDFEQYDEQDIQSETGLVRNRCSDPANAQITKHGNFMNIILRFGWFVEVEELKRKFSGVPTSGLPV